MFSFVNNDTEWQDTDPSDTKGFSENKFTTRKFQKL